MIKMMPYTFNQLKKRILFSNEAGDFFLASSDFLNRLMNDDLGETDKAYLLQKGFAYQEAHDLYYNSFLHRLAQRKHVGKNISYVIAVPTLRCDLKCDYCQVSRADLNTTGYDWSPEIVEAFKKFLNEQKGRKIKIEFQGGEPTVRTDIIRDIVDHCDQENIEAEFIVCTNLSTLSDEIYDLLKRKDFYLSTSIDGAPALHTQFRTKDINLSERVLYNYKRVQEIYGADKINALPTIACQNFDNIKSIIDFYITLGQKNIFLRPVNYQGFARKKFSDVKNENRIWHENYKKALEYIFNYNFHAENPIVEVGLEIAAKRVFKSFHNGHVDLRSPNPAGIDYLVINYDGGLFPSDEARMLSRIGHINLSLGNILTGLNKEQTNQFNWNQLNEVHEDCLFCAYKPFCGVDNVDDLSRYSRTDLVKSETNFCTTQTSLFSFLFEKLERSDPIALYNFQGHLTGKFSSNPVTSGWLHD